MLTVAGLGWWAWQRSAITEQQRIQRTLTQLARAVEQRQWLRLEEGISPEYADAFGLDKAGLLMTVRAFRAQYEAIWIYLSDWVVTVAPDGETAEVTLIARVLGKPTGAVAETEIRAERYRVRLRRGDQGWRLIGAEVPELRFD